MRSAHLVLAALAVASLATVACSNTAVEADAIASEEVGEVSGALGARVGCVDLSVTAPEVRYVWMPFAACPTGFAPAPASMTPANFPKQASAIISGKKVAYCHKPSSSSPTTTCSAWTAGGEVTNPLSAPASFVAALQEPKGLVAGVPTFAVHCPAFADYVLEKIPGLTAAGTLIPPVDGQATSPGGTSRYGCDDGWEYNSAWGY